MIYEIILHDLEIVYIPCSQISAAGWRSTNEFLANSYSSVPFCTCKKNKNQIFWDFL